MIQNLKMKRILVILPLVFLLTACSGSPDPVIKGYRLRQTGGLAFGAEGVTTDLTLELDIDNPSASRYTLESLEAVLYLGNETSRFADVLMQEAVSIEPRSEETVSLPLHARFTRPLALLGGGFSTDLSAYTADVDLIIRRGSFKKRITQKRIPLDRIGNLLGQNEKKEKDEKE